MPRNRFVFTAPIVLAIVIIGVFAIRSRTNHDATVDTTKSHNCPPVARADAAATKPATPVVVDVLANDTDPDGDPLVFDIRDTTGGEAAIDDGGTPTDAGDDRVLFTPADPPPAEATVEYQAIDPDGAVSDAEVNIVINADGVLPAGVQSDPVTAGGGSGGTRCASDRTATPPTLGDFPSQDAAPSVSGEARSKRSTAKRSRRHAQPREHTTRPRQTATSQPREIIVGTRSPGTTQPEPATTTTAPPPPTTQTTDTTQPDPCGPYPVNGSDTDKDAWRDCEIAHSGG